MLVQLLRIFQTFDLVESHPSSVQSTNNYRYAYYNLRGYSFARFLLLISSRSISSRSNVDAPSVSGGSNSILQ